MSIITTHTENINLNFYVLRQSVSNKNLLSYELLLRNSPENRHVSAPPTKTFKVLVLTLGLKRLAQDCLAFISLGHDPLIHIYCLSSKQYFQPIISVLTPYLCIQSPTEKIETYSNLPPASIDVTQTEGLPGACEC
jgi:hypothetical protein